MIHAGLRLELSRLVEKRCEPSFGYHDFGRDECWGQLDSGMSSLCSCSSNLRLDPPVAPSQLARSYRSSLSRHIMNLLLAKSWRLPTQTTNAKPLDPWSPAPAPSSTSITPSSAALAPNTLDTSAERSETWLVLPSSLFHRQRKILPRLR